MTRSRKKKIEDGQRSLLIYKSILFWRQLHMAWRVKFVRLKMFQDTLWSLQKPLMLPVLSLLYRGELVFHVPCTIVRVPWRRGLSICDLFVKMLLCLYALMLLLVGFMSQRSRHSGFIDLWYPCKYLNSTTENFKLLYSHVRARARVFY